MNRSNRMNAAVRVVALLIASFVPALAAAQAGGAQALPMRLTLAQALATAEAHYPRVRIALEQQIAAQEGIAVARTAYLPRADMLWQTNRATANNVYGLLLPQGVIPAISGPVIPADNSRSAWGSATGALLSWEPFDFGLRHAQVNVAQQGERIAAAGLDLTRLDVEVATANAYFTLVAAEQFASIAQANVHRLQVFAAAAHVLVNNQLRPGADAAQADAGLALARTQWIQARTNVEIRRAEIADLLGSPNAQFELDYANLLSRAPAEGPGPSSMALHPAALQEAARVGRQQAQMSALSRSYAPKFTVETAISGRGTGAELNGLFSGGTSGLAPNTLNWAAGVQITFPAFDFFSIRARKKVQGANLRAEQARYQQTLDDLSMQVRQARAQLQGARKAAQNTPVELAAARENETQQRARFQSGLATVIEVAAAESLLVQAEADDAVARLNVWRALMGLAAARGDLGPFIALINPQP